MKLLPIISPITKPGNFSYTPIIDVSKESIPSVHSMLVTPFNQNLLSSQLPPLIENNREIQKQLQKIERTEAVNEENSSETDRMVEEELCSFLSTVEATEAKEKFFNKPPISPAHLDSTIDDLQALEPQVYFIPTVPSIRDANQNIESASILPFHMSHTISPILPLGTNQPLKGGAVSTPKISRPSPFIRIPAKESYVEFKTPKDMHLFTSLDEPSDSPPVQLQADEKVFEVSIATTPLNRPQRQPLATFAQNSKATNVAKFFKKVSFGSLLTKSDTGYGSSPISKEIRLNEGPIKSLSKVSEPTMERKSEREAVKEIVERKGLLKTLPSSEVEHELLREGWDQLATFIYCYNILRKFDSENADFVYLSAPRTPPHYFNHHECPRDTCISSTADINLTVQAPSSSFTSSYPPQAKNETIDLEKTSQVEE